MAAEGYSDTTASDMEVCMKQRCVTEFPHVEKITLTDIHWHLLNVSGDQTVDVSIVRQWVVAVAIVTVDYLCWCSFSKHSTQLSFFAYENV